MIVGQLNSGRKRALALAAFLCLSLAVIGLLDFWWMRLNAVEKVDSGVFNWISLDWHGGDQFFSSSDLYSWEDETNRSPIFYANGNKKYLGDSPGGLLSHVFLKQHIRKLVGFEVANLRKLLEESKDVGTEFKDIYMYRLTSDYRITYEIFLFVENEMPQWILVCIDYCRDKKPDVLSVVRK